MWPRQTQRVNLWLQRERETDSESFWISSMAYTRSKSSFYLIHCVAGSYKSWELHRLEERLWDSPAALLHHPRRSGGLSHTSPSICGGRKKNKKKQAISQVLLGVNLCSTLFPSHECLKICFFSLCRHISLRVRKPWSWCSILSLWCASTNCFTSCWLVWEAIPTYISKYTDN